MTDLAFPLRASASLYPSRSRYKILHGDCLKLLQRLGSESVQACVTSPPYFGLRDYGVDGQLGLEISPAEYVANMSRVFREVRRVLAKNGVLWLNLGDSFATSGTRGSNKTGIISERSKTAQILDYRPRADGFKSKDLLGIPWRVAFALQSDGYYLRSDIIWHKPNPMPESVTDRPTRSHEYIFLLTKSESYFYNADAIREPAVSLNPEHPSYRPNSWQISQTGRKTYRGKKHFETFRTYPVGGRNRRSVWTVATHPFKGSHFATFPQKLIEPCILAGSKPGDTVLDPFNGAGTTGLVAMKHRRYYVGMEINSEYIEMSKKRYRENGLW